MNDVENEFDIHSVLGMIRRQLRIILTTVAVILALTLLALFSMTPKFTASTLLLVDVNASNLLEGEGSIASAASEDARVASEVEILRSDAVALAVVEAKGLVTDSEFGVKVGRMDRLRAAVGFQATSEVNPNEIGLRIIRGFQGASHVNRRGITHLIEVAVSSESPEKAAELANQMAQSYIELQLQSKIDNSLAARDSIALRLNEANADLIASEQAFDTFIEENIRTIEEEADSTLLTDLRLALEAAREESIRNDVLATEVQRGLDSSNWADIAERLQSDAIAELNNQRAQLAASISDSAANSAESINLRAQLAQIERQLQEESEEAIGSLMVNVSEMEGRVTDYEQQLRNTILASELPPRLLTEIFSIQQQASLARTQYQSLLVRLQDFETEADLQVANARVVSPALPPANPSFPNEKLMLGLALVVALGLGTAIGLLREFYVGGFTSTKQVADVLGVEVASSAPRIAGSSGDDILPADRVISAQLSPYAESIRRLRAGIEQRFSGASVAAKDPKKSKVIMVTSTLPGEGKSTTSLALARTYAMAGKKALLIDADLRKPSVAEMLGMDPEVGMLHYLSQADTSLDQVLTVDDGSGLNIALGAGRSSQPTDQLLTSDRFEELMKSARDAYDVIVIDTPPLLPVVDGLYLAGMVDAIVMIIKWADTRQQDSRTVIKPLMDAKRPETPVYAFLNQLETTRRSAYYRGYYNAYGGSTY